MYLSTRETVVGPFKIYKDVDGKFKNFTDGCRVLPSTYFENEYTTVFTLKRRYEPGENKTFKNGGFEVYGPSGEIRNFDLDQVIVHPFELKMTKFFEKEDNVVVANETVKDGVKRKRGRPSLGLDAKEKVAYVPTGGRRGRPSSVIPKAPKVSKGGKRGRPSLSDAEKLVRQAELEAKAKKSGGKRGRPAKSKKSK